MKQVADTETAEIIKIAREMVGLPGDFVELGCYEGDTSLLLAEVLRDAKASSQKLWIYDSFEGLPAKSSEDFSVAGEAFTEGVLSVSKRDVKLRFLRANLPVPVIKKAWFSDLTDADLPAKIAFAFLDGDLYQSIKDSLKLVGDKMVNGGVILVHDYNNPELPGVTKAVDEWIKNKNLDIVQKDTLAIIEF
jgi:O-methyltransferase